MSYLSLWLFLLLNSHVGEFAKSWRGIVPLHSTRDDVERILKVTSARTGLDKFNIDGSTVRIRYTVSSCPPEGRGKWNVPIGTVVSVSVIPGQKVLLSDLRLDLAKFRVSGTDVVGVNEYTNSEEGFHIEASEKSDRVFRFYYFETEKDKKLLCTNTKQN